MEYTDRKSLIEAVREHKISVRSANLMMKQLKFVENTKNDKQQYNNKTAA